MISFNELKSLNKLPLGSIQPKGWILNELKNLDSLQKRIASLRGLLPDGEWKGGENFPRYVRSLILLSSVLDDDDLKNKADEYIDIILKSQLPNGDFGPLDNRSLTPKIEAIKAVMTYYEVKHDNRVIGFLKNYFKYQFNTLEMNPTWHNSRARLMEEIPAINMLYQTTKLIWLQSLAEQIRDISNNWFATGYKFIFKKDFNDYIPEKRLNRTQKLVSSYALVTKEELEGKSWINPERIEAEWKKKDHQMIVEGDGVNLAKSVKYAVQYGKMISDWKLYIYSIKLIESLDLYHGTPLGMFTCDEFVGGNQPEKGIDLQATVEYLESLLEVIEYTNQSSLVDKVERIAYNLIPASIMSNEIAVQDMIQTNQIHVDHLKRYPYSDNRYSNAYITKKVSKGGIAVLQAYPFLLQSACMTRKDEIHMMAYMPCVMKIPVEGGGYIVIEEKTDYPFRNTVQFKVLEASKDVQTKLFFRAPSHSRISLIMNEKTVSTSDKSISVTCILKKGSIFSIKLNIPYTVEEKSNKTCSLFKGNVLLSSKLACTIGFSREQGQERRIISATCDNNWHVAPLLVNSRKDGLKVGEVVETIVNPIKKNTFDFENPPFEAVIKSKNIVNWKKDSFDSAPLPKKGVFLEETHTKRYIPFGCGVLHVAQFPISIDKIKTEENYES